MKILIIGAGIAGLYAALDANLRGAECTIIDKGQIGSGTTGKATGLLHSGARYAVSDPTVAELCSLENPVYKNNFPFAVGKGPGLFVTLDDADPSYIDKFEKGIKSIGIPIHKINRTRALQIEPFLSPEVTGGYLTPDVSLDPGLITLSLGQELRARKVTVLENTSLIKGSHQGGTWQITLADVQGIQYKASYDAIVNTAGAWSADVVNRLGGTLKLVYIHGTVIVLDKPKLNQIVSLVGENRPGDVLIPHNNYINVGATWKKYTQWTEPKTTETDLALLRKGAKGLIPNTAEAKIVNSYTGIRTHLGYSDIEKGDYGISRNYMIASHGILDRLPGLFTALAGKLILGRLVAEKTIDKVFEGQNIPSQTKDYRLTKPH